MGRKSNLKKKSEEKKTYNKETTKELDKDDPTSVPEEIITKEIGEKEIKRSRSVIIEGKERIIKEDDTGQNITDKRRITLRGKGNPIKGISSLQKLNILSKNDGSILEQIDLKRPPKYESWSEEVNFVALQIVDMFHYDEILDGAKDPRDAPTICGWLQDHYRNYQWLIDNYVLEVAAWYAKNKRKSKVKIVSVISGIPLELYKWSKVDLPRIHRLENYSKQPFNNIIFVGEDYLDEAVYWLENSEWIINNELVRVNLGRFCGDLIAWLDWNIPVILLTYLPFRNKGLYKASAQAAKILKMEEDMKLKVIHVYKQQVDRLEKQIDDLKRESKEWRKMYYDTNKNISLLLRREQERRRYAEEAREEGKKFGGITIFLICAVIALGILSVVAFLT